MKLFKFLFLSFSIFAIQIFCAPHMPNSVSHGMTIESNGSATTPPMMSIVIDDFGSYDQSGVETLLNSDVAITGAVIPFTDNTQQNIEALQKSEKEIILHMPMESHVHLPENWYGKIYIKNSDSPETAIQKIETCLKDFPNIKGFNIHIGSGVSRSKTLMTAIYNFAKNNNLYFLDSRTIETHATKDACKETNSIYLGRDEFLEADKNKSYSGVIFRLNQGAKTAKEKGYSIVIGHVGAEGGEQTAKAIIDFSKEAEKLGVKIVPLSEIFEYLKIKNK